MFIHATAFSRAWKNFGFNDEDLRKLELTLLKNPKVGDVMQGTRRLRKVRFAFQNQGKSDSVRVCYADFEEKGILYLFAVFAKNEQEN